MSDDIRGLVVMAAVSVFAVGFVVGFGAGFIVGRF